MASFYLFAALLAVLAHCIYATDADFDFDVSDDLIDEDWDWNSHKYNAYIGKVFHLAITKRTHGRNAIKYEAKRYGGKPLPSWLLFDKIDGTFWGVPLSEDSGSTHIIVRCLDGNRTVVEEFSLDIMQPSFELKGVKKCSPTEDNTILTLLIDKGIKTIKPKQRVVAINDISKFFGLPYSAFTLKSQDQPDDITDSSVVLAGPGNLHSRSSKLTSLLEVLVGCDGRLWVLTTTLIHQLKQQARDGTISEVLRLPIIGWRVKTETKPILRIKRQTDDIGSGEYEGDYEDYDDDEYDDDTGLDEITTTSTSSITPTAPPTSSLSSVTHQHRHHHGEINVDGVFDDFMPKATTLKNTTNGVSTSDIESRIEPQTTPFVPEPVTFPTTTTTTTPLPPPAETTHKVTTTSVLPTRTTTITTTTQATNKPITITPETDDEYSDNEYEDIEDYDLGLVESETIVPDVSKQLVPKGSEIIPTTTETQINVDKETTPLYPVTFSKVEEQTTAAIIEDFQPETVISTLPTTEYPTTPIPTTSAPVTTSTATTTTTETPTTIIISTSPITAATTTSPTTTTTTTTPIPTTELTTAIPNSEETTSLKITTVRHLTTTPSAPTTIRETVESVEYETKNFSPYIENRLKQKYVMAGKIFRFVIPGNTFKDLEEGYDLKVEFFDAEENPIGPNSWCQFNPTRREVYGLPLEEDVFKWEYVVKATDKEGASVKDHLTIQVQQHKQQRSVNHEFSLEIRIEKQEEFRHYVDWSLKTLRGLGRIFNTNMSEITVKKVNYSSQPVVFTWSNDSIPTTNYCPKMELDKLFKVLTANDRGDPSRELNLALAPELRVKKVVYHGIGPCEEKPTHKVPPMNYPPILRNPVNHVNATVGDFLLFKVPVDTFYDPEDVDVTSLNITLLTVDRQELPSSSWLQFDYKNREFYGIPRKPSRNEYQLVCIDSGGLLVTDSLDVVVIQSPKVLYNVEFSMTVEILYDTFINSASLQKKFVEKLVKIFSDRNASYIHFNPFKQKQLSTIITWYNTSLSASNCPNDEINRLESILKNNERGINNRVHSIMEPEFPISTIKVLLLNSCKVLAKPKYQTPKSDDKILIDESTPQSSSDEYLVTFIVPAIIISIMLFLAIVAACVLYRRRRTGKMNVVEDGRQSYGNKGIPVIFQEELEEKPESGTKTPVILKDEKPPLAPPEYSKSGSLKLNDDSEPYQPPPPFTRTQDNGKQSRPKPTPTYRKPPPYVPP